MSVEGTNLIPVRRNAAFEAHNHDHGAHDEHGAEHHDDHAHDDHAHDDHVDKDSHADHEDHAHEEKGDHDDHASKDHSDHDDHGHDDHADHDDHGHESDTAGMDPHVWLDPRNAALWVKTVAEELAAMDPANAETYRANAANAQAGLKDLERQISEKLTGYEANAFIVFHDSYHYFEDRFDVEARAAITFSDGSSASAAQLAEVREVVIETGAACALTEPGANEGLVAAVDEGDTLSIETADAIGVNLPLGSGFYDALLNQISDALVNCFDTSS